MASGLPHSHPSAGDSATRTHPTRSATVSDRGLHSRRRICSIDAPSMIMAKPAAAIGVSQSNACTIVGNMSPMLPTTSNQPANR